MRQCSLNLFDNHFMMYISQIIMLYTLNLHSAVCQLYLNKTERKKLNSQIVDSTGLDHRGKTHVKPLIFGL